MKLNRSETEHAVTNRRRNALPLLALSLAIASVSFCTARDAQSASLEKLGGLVPGYVTSNIVNEMPVADFDGDMLSDVVVLGNTNYSDVVQILGFQAGSGWKIKQSLVPELTSSVYSSGRIAAWTDTSGAHLLYARDNAISIYSGWPLALQNQFQIASGYNFSDVKVADVDNDGIPELIALSPYSSNGLVAYSLGNGDQLWSAAVGPTYYASLHVAQLDADPALEIVVSGVPGTIVDGATRATEWVYKDGFAQLLQHGRFGGSSTRLASLDNRLLMFQSEPWSPVWDLPNIEAGSASVADIDGDNVDELIVGSLTYPRRVHVVDVQTQAYRSTFEQPNLMWIAAADFDGDAQKEVAMSLQTDSPQYETNSFRVIDAVNGGIEYVLPTNAPGPYVAGGLLSGAGGTDIIFGSAGMTEYPGVITRMDTATGALRWQIAGDDSAVGLSHVAQIQTANLIGQAQPVVLVLGTSYYDYHGQIVALNASNGNLLWSMSSTNGSFPDSASVVGMAAIDLDGDTLNDSVLACTSDTRLRLLDTTTRLQTWSSVAMSGDCRGAMPMTTGGHLQLVAVLTGALRAYDAQTHLLSWSIPFQSGLSGATYLPHGATGPEIALFNDYSISFYDAQSRALLRELSFSTDNPVQAIVQTASASIHDLVVTVNGKLRVLDGITGETRTTSEPVGRNAGLGNQLAVFENPDGSALIASGSDVAVFTHRLDGLLDAIFANGFDGAAQ